MSVHIETAFARSPLLDLLWATVRTQLNRYIAGVERSARSVAMNTRCPSRSR